MQPITNSARDEEWQVTTPEIMDTDKYLSSANAPDLEEDARLCIQSGARDMVLNCAALTYATGAGMRAILNIARMMQAVDGVLTVQNLFGQPRDIFYACSMDMMITVGDKAVGMSSDLHQIA